ncbi:MAG: hypothetical protein LBG47_10590 [Prevotellaceae bacterium]|jgi:hypothetical protein|nr:hypothetical protein [Prevotellaceae bacterium]
MPFNNTYIPYYSLSPNTLTLFQQPEGIGYAGRTSAGFKNLSQTGDNAGELSPHARIRLKRAIRYMLYITRSKTIQGRDILAKTSADTIEYERGDLKRTPVAYKLTFVTLTLPSPQQHSDLTIKSLALNQFLTEAKTLWHMDLYVWKAEKQRNGNIHFHILSNRYIPHLQLRSTWNRIINKPPLQYVDTYSRRMQAHFSSGFKPFDGDHRSLSAQRKAYEVNKANGWTQPNSTDVHALYKVANVEAYISKYIAKDVTKTSRTQRIQRLKSAIAKLQERIDAIRQQPRTWEDVNTYYDRIKAITAPLAAELKAAEEELKRIADMGVKGRIWGCSATLSKCRNLTNAGSFTSIPDFNTVQDTATYRISKPRGYSTVDTYVFDIERTPTLKSMLNEHIAKCAYEYQW